MINFTVGPVQMDKETRALEKNQIPYFRTPEFSATMKENEKIMCSFFDAPKNSKCVFMTGSGTASMEASVMNFFSTKDKVLVVNGGTFGERLVELCTIHEIPFTEIKLEYGTPLTKEMLEKYAGKKYTGMMLQLCETSTGILYDMKMVGQFCKENNLFLMVDAVSGFLADKFSMKRMNVNVAITGSQKALSLPPGLSFIVCDETAQTRCINNKVKSMYFDLKDYFKNGERGQTPFTPAVGTLLMLNEKLNRMVKEGGVTVQNQKAKERAEYFRNSIKHLPLKMFTKPKNSSNAVTALMPANKNISAYDIFTEIKDKYGIWVCPNGGDMRDKIFRVGHIGCISKEEIDKLVKAFDSLVKKGKL